MSDGETNEGTTWEAAHFAVANGLDNLIIIIDNNGLQGFGNLNDVLGDSADSKKWDALGFDVVSIDGHDIGGLIASIGWLKKQKNNKPKVIIAKTVKGKGVSYMENQLDWHYLPMSEQQYQHAVKEIELKYSR
jgi:transketolase